MRRSFKSAARWTSGVAAAFLFAAVAGTGNAQAQATSLCINRPGRIKGINTTCGRNQDSLSWLTGGFQGPAGPVGPQGPQGIAGLQGPQGPLGAQGPAGVAGAPGVAGGIGLTGPIGAQGAAGPQGVAAGAKLTRVAD